MYGVSYLLIILYIVYRYVRCELSTDYLLYCIDMSVWAIYWLSCILYRYVRCELPTGLDIMYSCWSMWPSLPCVQQETLFTSPLRKTFPKRFLKSVWDCTQIIKFNFLLRFFSFSVLWTVIFHNSFLTHFLHLKYYFRKKTHYKKSEKISI